MLNKGWVDASRVKPPEDTLIQFVIVNKDGFGEYWGQYENGIYKGYVSAEMPYPKYFNENKHTIYAWKKTELSVKNKKLAYKMRRRIRI